MADDDDERWRFDGWPQVADMVRERAHEAAYLILQDRTERTLPGGGEPTVERFDFDNRAELAKARRTMGSTTPARPSYATDDDDEDESDEEEEEEEEEDDADEAALCAQLAEQAIAKMHDAAIRCCMGESHRRFRLRVHGPKGDKIVASGNFTLQCLDGGDENLPVPPAPPVQASPGAHAMPSVAELDAKVIPSTLVKPYKALGDHFAQLLTLVFSSMQHIQGLHLSLNDQFAGQNKDLWRQNDQLLATIVTLKGMEGVNAAARDDDDTKKRKLQVAEKAIDKMGEIGKLLMMTKGLDPALAEIFSQFADDPRFKAIIAQPELKEVLSSAANREAFVGMLQRGVEIHKMNKAAEELAAQAAKDAAKAEAGAKAKPATGKGGGSDEAPAAKSNSTAEAAT